MSMRVCNTTNRKTTASIAREELFIASSLRQTIQSTGKPPPPNENHYKSKNEISSIENDLKIIKNKSYTSKESKKLINTINKTVKFKKKVIIHD